MAYLRETILESIRTNAALITIANGYENNVSQAIRYPTEQDSEVEAAHFAAGAPLLFLLDGDPEDAEQEKDQWAVWVLRPKLRCLLASTVTTPSTAMNSLIGDIKKFIKNNRTTWHAQVINTRVTQVSILPDATRPHAGFDVSLEVKYETTDTLL